MEEIVCCCRNSRKAKRELQVVAFGLPESEKSAIELRRNGEQNQSKECTREVVGSNIELKNFIRLGRKN